MAQLPPEILAAVVEYAPKDTLLNLSLVSRAIYSITTPMLYASIPELSMPRTIRCLLTLSARPELASIIRSFRLKFSFSHPFRAFHTLLNRALSNMTSLHILSIQPNYRMPSNIPISSVLNQLPCQLRELTYLAFGNLYPVSQFLLTQPTIEKLAIICPPNDLVNLDPDALPVLRELSTSLRLLSAFSLSRFSRLSQLCVLGDASRMDQLLQLAGALGVIKHLRLLRLIISIDITASPVTIEHASVGLAYIGLAAPFISSLTLNIHRGYTQKDELQDMFTFILPKFPNLRVLKVISPPPQYGASNFRMRPTETFSELIYAVHREVLSLPDLPTNAPFQLLLDAPVLPAPGPKPGLGEDNTSLIWDAVYDKSCHPKILRAWSEVHSGLEWVLFPDARYNLEKFRSG